MSRLLIVSNRLPVTVGLEDGAPRIEPSTGGLAVGLSGPHARGSGRWIGWPGDLSELDEPGRDEVRKALEAQRLVPVELSREEVRGFYERFSNAVLWPLFHFQPGSLPLEITDFELYAAVNARFADAVAEVYRDGDRIWVQDYQLLLLPGLLRDRLPGARIGFFLHIPFPSSEIVRILPHREELLAGMLGADLIGFHTATYLRHFGAAALRVLGAPHEVDRIRWGGREVRVGVFPMGVDARGFAHVAGTAAVRREVEEGRARDDTRMLLGVDRLDYTKGIRRRLLAFERLLERHPELRERVRLVQVGVPSREDVAAYQTFRSEVDGLIGRIHGAFATPSWVPVHWIYRGFSREELVALYRSADVLLVTPLRDGMNLVAKEFVASRIDEDGVLVLSEFAGAAAELAEALLVNPYDVEATAETIHRALTLPPAERRERMRALRLRVFAADVDRWAASFLAALGEAGAQGTEALEPTPDAELAALAAELAGAPNRLLLLDYDGTLVGFAPRPPEAAPDAELLALLGALATAPGNDVHVVSGRDAETLEAWLGDLPVTLHAEHGALSRPAGTKPWIEAPQPVGSWRPRVLAILEDFAHRTPGALVEEKRTSIAWHHRAADPVFGAVQAKELHLHLLELLSNVPVEILSGDQVLDVRPHGIHKGRIVGPALEDAAEGARVVALGDDRTDEDLFSALPDEGVSIHVGPRASRARYRIADVAGARRFLHRLLAGG